MLGLGMMPIRAEGWKGENLKECQAGALRLARLIGVNQGARNLRCQASVAESDSEKSSEVSFDVVRLSARRGGGKRLSNLGMRS